ncbi:MAG: hypothetical protein Q7K16_02140 [Candidatus Azambacteria bacterium]|nr:hypothetical protein [Candidatus Azambacteria bacterium]
MNKLIRLIKNTTYLKLCGPRQLMAMVGVVGSLLSSATGVPVALADEGFFDGNSAFLTVQPLLLEEKENSFVMWQNNIFASISQRSLAVAAVASPAKTQGRVVIVTAYSSTPDQTDDSPFITANGTYVHDGIVATNFLPFGTKVRFPEYSGDKVYTVQDRMAKKNSHKIDIWMATRGDALQFGVKKLAYEVVE